MATKRPKPEELVSKLRQVEVLMMQVTRLAGSTCTGGNQFRGPWQLDKNSSRLRTSQ